MFSPRRGLRVAWRRLLDAALGTYRDIPPAGRSRGRVDFEPQLRGPSSACGWTHLMSPAMAAAAAVTGRLADVREPGGARAVTIVWGPVAALAPGVRRQRPDHPEAVPEAHRAHRLRRVPVRRLDGGPRLSRSAVPSSPRRRSSQPAATSAAAARASTRPGRFRVWLPGGRRRELRRYLQDELLEDPCASGAPGGGRPRGDRDRRLRRRRSTSRRRR